MKYRVLTDHNGRHAYPWTHMKVGDYFDVAVQGCGRCLQQAVGTAAAMYAKKRNWKFTTENTGVVVRCQRVK